MDEYKMLKNWERIFEDDVLGRGKYYYRDGMVKEYNDDGEIQDASAEVGEIWEKIYMVIDRRSRDEMLEELLKMLNETGRPWRYQWLLKATSVLILKATVVLVAQIQKSQ